VQWVWLQDANCFGTRTWLDALSDCNGLADGSCGLTDGSIAGDWRLPNNKELFSLVDAKRCCPALPLFHLFDNVLSSYYWTSTTRIPGSGDAWCVDMYDGDLDHPGKTLYQAISVWPVRDPL